MPVLLFYAAFYIIVLTRLYLICYIRYRRLLYYLQYPVEKNLFFPNVVCYVIMD